MGKLNEKRIELSNPYPVKKNEIIDIVERSSRLTYTATDDKTIQLYIYSNGSDRPEAFAEVEITSVGYILHGAEGYDYQGNSLKEFEDDLRNIVFHFDAITSKRFGENKEQFFDSLLNEADDTYKAKVQGKWLKGNKLVKDKKDADTFESKTEPTQRINQMKKDGKLNKNAKPNIVKESIDPTSSAFNLTKLKGYLRFETRWEYDEDYPEDAMLVDKVHDPARFTVNWIGPEGKKHPNTYCVNIRKDRGESWTWITHFCLKASDAAEMINLEVGTWEHNNMSWKFESKEVLFNHLLNEDGLFKPFAGFALTMAALTAIGIQTKNFDEKCKAIADELGVKLGKNAFDQRGAAYYMPYLQSFKYDGGSKDYGMTPEGLCEYIKKTAKVDNVIYEKVDGGVEISFVDRYSVNIGNVIHRREARGSFLVPDDYFGVSFIFQESENKINNKNQLFESILQEKMQNGNC